MFFTVLKYFQPIHKHTIIEENVFLAAVKLIRCDSLQHDFYSRYCKNSSSSVILEMRRSLKPVLLLLSLNSLVGLSILSNGLRERYHRNPTKAFVNGGVYRSIASLSGPTRIYSSTASTDISNYEGSSTVGSISGKGTAEFRIPRLVSHFYS